MKKDGDVFAYANRKEFSRFLEYNIPFEILPHPGNYDGDLNMLSNINIRDVQDWDFYPTYDAYVSMMQQFALDYPDICQVFSIGTTVQGRELLVARISDNVGISENEPQCLFTSSMHGDETTGYILTLRMIDYLLSNYGSDPRVTDLVNNIDIWINPLANPDGTYHGGNFSVNYAQRFNANGVDLNRNYPDPEAGAHPDGNAWQPETVAFMNMAENNHFVSSVNFHGGNEVCNYPWDTWPRLAADNSWWVYVCREYVDTVHVYSPSNYMSDFDNGITNGYAWYWVTGGRQDYMNYFQQCREFTLEISNTKLLPPAQLPAYWEYNYRSMLNYMEQSTFGINGTVKDSVTGFGIEAEVNVVAHESDSSWVYSKPPIGRYSRLLYQGNYTVRYSANGYYPKIFSNVAVTNRNATVLNVVLVPEGVGGIEYNDAVSKSIRMLPNPLCGSTLHLEANFPIKRITFINTSGQIVLRKNIYDTSANLSLEALKNGLYIISLETIKGNGAKKLIINR